MHANLLTCGFRTALQPHTLTLVAFLCTSEQRTLTCQAPSWPLHASDRTQRRMYIAHPRCSAPPRHMRYCAPCFRACTRSAPPPLSVPVSRSSAAARSRHAMLAHSGKTRTNNDQTSRLAATHHPSSAIHATNPTGVERCGRREPCCVHCLHHVKLGHHARVVVVVYGTRYEPRARGARHHVCRTGGRGHEGRKGVVAGAVHLWVGEEQTHASVGLRGHLLTANGYGVGSRRCTAATCITCHIMTRMDHGAVDVSRYDVCASKAPVGHARSQITCG